MTSRKPPNKISSWVVSSFGDFGPGLNSAPDKKAGKRTRETTIGGDARKKKRQQQQQQQQEGRSSLWVDLYAPSTRDDLAVHKRKVQEVESWLVENAAGMKGRKVLLLTGPSGCGKSATVRVLAREAGLNLVEWTNPTTTPHNDTFMDLDRSGSSRWRPGDTLPVSQTTQFWEFLMRCSKYNSVCRTGGKGGNLVCVEDFPNAILRDPASFHAMLRKYSQWERSSPLVFIVTDSTTRYGNVKQLFPPDILNQLTIINIVFNPIANSLMLKALTRIMNIESVGESARQTLPSKEVLQSLVEASGGDVRSAINALQFATRKDPGNIDGLFASKNVKASSSRGRSSKSSSSSSSSKSKQTSEEENIAVGGKDASLFLFRALGKVLYCKRSTDRGITEPLPDHLKKHERLPLQEVPETVYEKTSMGTSSFSLFLHQNYLSFFTDIEAVTKAAHYFSDSDVLMADWMERSVLEDYASSVTSRGLMYANQHGTSGGGWRPLTRPQWYTVTRESQQRSLVLKDEYSKHSLTTEELMTVLLPLKCKIVNASSHTTQEVGRISSVRRMNYPERLGELDISSAVTECEEGETASTSSSLPKESTVPATSVSMSSVLEEEEKQEDDELFIEDPDD